MTETQAKSGASGAPTDAPEPGTREENQADAVGAASRDADRPTESPSGSSPLESPTNLIRSEPTSGSGTGGGSGDKPATSSPAASSAGTYMPRVASSTPPPVVAPISSLAGTSAAGAGGGTNTQPSSASPAIGLGGRIADAEPTVRTSGSVPVVGVPAGAPSRPVGTATGRISTAPGLKATPPAAPPGVSPATGRATVVPSTKSTTVTGTGLRQTSGATSVVGAPARPGMAAVGAARVSDTLRSARATVAGAATRGPRRARLHLKRIDPWSVMKFSFAVSLVLFVVAIVATSVLYLALDAMNVFDSINKAFAEVTGQVGGAEQGFKITAKGVIGTAVLLGAVNMVLFTALATLGAFVYNVCADLVGGVELTLSEKE